MASQPQNFNSKFQLNQFFQEELWNIQTIKQADGKIDLKRVQLYLYKCVFHHRLSSMIDTAILTLFL